MDINLLLTIIFLSLIVISSVYQSRQGQRLIDKLEEDIKFLRKQLETCRLQSVNDLAECRQNTQKVLHDERHDNRELIAGLKADHHAIVSDLKTRIAVCMSQLSNSEKREVRNAGGISFSGMDTVNIDGDIAGRDIDKDEK